MEIAQAGVRTRSRAALAMGAATSPPPTPKRRKINNNNNNNNSNSNNRRSNRERKFSTASSSALAQLGSRRSAGSAVEPETAEAAAEERCPSPTSDEFPASCCCSNGSVGLNEERIELSDLEVESAQVETSTCNCGEEETERREMSRRENSQELESMETNSHRAISTAQNMPTELELEEFFSAAEKDIQKRFQDKYNYDIVKDVPLEGRYEWVELKP